MLIGERILDALNRANKSQADLARYLSTNTSTITGWIKGGKVPSADRILPICEFAGVSPVWLLSGEGELVAESIQESALLGAFRTLPSVGREIALKQVIVLSEAFPVTEEASRSEG